MTAFALKHRLQNASISVFTADPGKVSWKAMIVHTSQSSLYLLVHCVDVQINSLIHYRLKRRSAEDMRTWNWSLLLLTLETYVRYHITALAACIHVQLLHVLSWLQEMNESHLQHTLCLYRFRHLRILYCCYNKEYCMHFCTMPISKVE